MTNRQRNTDKQLPNPLESDVADMNEAELLAEMIRLARFSPAHDKRLALVEHAFTRMSGLANTCRLCRECMQNRPVNIYAKYCYAPCTPQSDRRAEPRNLPNPNPDVVFTERPTYRQLRELLTNGETTR